MPEMQVSFATTTSPALAADSRFEPLVKQPLEILANLLHDKVSRDAGGARSRVLAFVGAGPSAAAGLPLGARLKEAFYEALVHRAGPDAAIREFLAREIESRFGESSGRTPSATRVDDLSLFEFAALLSSFAYGRDTINDVIETVLARPTYRPLAYELLAHLAKHRYIDHFIVLNYDTLLDDALRDELPERIHVVATPQQIPEQRASGRECFLVRPFGTLGQGPYSITTDDVSQFGPEPIRRFLRGQILGWPRDRAPEPVILLVVGYAAAEPAFRTFFRWVSSGIGTEESRRVTIFAVDPRPALPETISRLERPPSVSVHHIAATADMGFEILLELLRVRWKRPAWTPASRHKIISKLCSHEQLVDKPRRFRLELLLQAVKARGFLHLESFGRVPRFRKYGGGTARAVIDDLLRARLIERDKWIDGPYEEEGREYVPNYMIRDNKDVAHDILSRSRREAQSLEIDEWRVVEREGAARTGGGRFELCRNRVPATEYLLALLGEIERAPEIEIVDLATPEAPWILGPDARPISGIGELTEVTEKLLKTVIRRAEGGEVVAMRGIWATGEWLFAKSGWAWSWGERILALVREGHLTLEVVLSKGGGVRGRRSMMRDEVIDRLRGAEAVIKGEDWWHVNRVITMVEARGGDDESSVAIYMRRRLSSPLVTPYYVRDSEGLRYLDEVWRRYWRRAEPVAGFGDKDVTLTHRGDAHETDAVNIWGPTR